MHTYDRKCSDPGDGQSVLSRFIIIAKCMWAAVVAWPKTPNWTVNIAYNCKSAETLLGASEGLFNVLLLL